MRRTIALLLLVLAGASLASCGKGSLTSTVVQSASSSTSQPSTPTTTPSTGTTGTTPSPSPGTPTTTSPRTTPSSPSQAPSHESAVAFARAVNLTSDDVPGFTPSEKHNSSSEREKRLERAMLRCAGIGAGTGSIGGSGKDVLEESSKDFQLKRQIIDFSVSSEVSVQASAAQALRGLQAIRSPHVRSCFSRYLSLIFKSEHVKGATAGPVTIQAGTPPAAGTSGGFGWRVTATFTVHGVKLPVYLDFLGFVDGPAEVTLTSSGLLRPFPASVQQHLFALLLTRAKAHKL